jgi:NTE family protein
MTGPAPYIQLLASIPAFRGLGLADLQAIYQACVLKVLAKGEAVSVAGVPVEELAIVVSGRVAGLEPGSPEAGQGMPIEARAFFVRGAAQADAIALRETVLLTLGWDDFLDAIRTNQALLEAFLAQTWHENAFCASAPAKLSRLVIAPAGPLTRLDPAINEALLAGLESAGEIRLLGSRSFGAGMPGALALVAPDAAHWLQELELEFDLTVTIAEEADAGFAREAIGEADGVLFVASGGDAALSALENHALEVRGGRNCRLVLAKGPGSSIKNPAAWLGQRPYRHAQVIDFASQASVRVLSFELLGKGHALAAASRGVYAAAILGALQALEDHDRPAVSLAAAGSAVLPAGLVACGVKLAVIEEIFRELANPLLWKRASRAEAGIYDPAAIDNFLVGALQGLEIPTANRLFAAVSHSISTGLPEVHREGRLHGAVRAGITPPGILPPLVLDSGAILISGEHETEALAGVARGLSSSPAMFIYAKPPVVGDSPMSYRSLTSVSQFRLPFQSQPTADKRLRLETVLSAATGSNRGAGSLPSFAIPIPDGIMPMDWPEWPKLRDAAYAWAATELVAGDPASDKNGVS